jgi:hypothetical protein
MKIHVDVQGGNHSQGKRTLQSFNTFANINRKQDKEHLNKR